MSACLKGHFHKEFVSTPKILVLIGKSKPLHYVPHFFFCVRVCTSVQYLWVWIFPQIQFPFFSTLETQCHLGIYEDKLMARLLSRWKCLTNFYIHWRDLPQMYLTLRLQPSLYLYTGKCSFFM